MSNDHRTTVVFVSGFMTPRDWKSYPEDMIPQNVNLIPVYPSPAGSLHDRACQIFYELYGGIVDYGSEHSSFHHHARFGRHFNQGKLPAWSKVNPIIIIGHSLGGCTAWVLQNYLAQQRFPGVSTSADWISGIICVNSPLNGALQVHGKGMDLCHPPVVRWGSIGCVIGWVAQWSEYVDSSIVNNHMDFQQEHWKLTRKDAGSFGKLLLSLLGYCLHSGTDNVAYDVTIQSQLAWAKVLRSFPESHYISVVGKLEKVKVKSWHAYELVSLCYSAVTKLLRKEAPSRICGVNTSKWMHTGSDGLLTVYTQEYPRLFTTEAANGMSATSTGTCQGECRQRPNSCTMCLPSGGSALKFACTPAWPQHIGRQFTSNELFSNHVELERGVWHFTHGNISHLSAGMGCKETWGFLMQAVQVLATYQREGKADTRTSNVPSDQKKQPSARSRSVGKNIKQQSSGQSSRVNGIKCPAPDMQPAAHLHLPCSHTSTAMAFRWSNAIFAVFLVSILAAPHWMAAGGVADAVKNMSVPSACFAVLCVCLFGAALACLIVCKPSPQSGAAYYYFANEVYLVAEAVEIVYSVYRVACASGYGNTAWLFAQFTTPLQPTELSSSSLLCEMLLLSLLPRPLFDHKNQPITVLLAVLLNFYPALWIASVKRVTLLYLALVLEGLAKLPWLVMFATRREDNKLSGAVLRRYFALGAMFLYLTCWALFAVELSTAYNHVTVTTSGTGVNRVIFLLWCLYPLSKFQDLSECVQYVMIERYY